MTESRGEKTRSQGTRRKRRVTRHFSTAANGDSDGDSAGNENELMTKWNYDLDKALHNIAFDHSNIVITIGADQFNMDFVYNTGLLKPFVITDASSKFDFKVPHEKELSVDEVAKLIGRNRTVEVIEVCSQGNRQMLLEDFVKYYKTSEEDRKELLNVLSLEFSHTPLANVVHPPSILREIDWVDLYWPKTLQAANSEADPTYGPFTFPKVKQYCFMGVKGCFTDFHINFGGTSVWYHVLKGKKVFWLVQPTECNLTLYEQWITNSSAGDSAFFGDIVESCCRTELNSGDTFIIPSGWIHAVYTPVDSIVFGGNFLHSFSIPMQLRIIKSEDKIKVSKKYRYPYYSEMLWYVVNGVVERVIGQSFVLAQNASKTIEDSGDGKGSGVVDNSKLHSELDKMQVDCSLPIPSCSKDDANVQKLEISFVSEEIGMSNSSHFDIEYLKKMTMLEYDGYCMLLKFLRKKLKTKQRDEVLKRFINPDNLLDLFEKLLQRKTEIDGFPTTDEDVVFKEPLFNEVSNKDYGVEILLDDFTKIDENAIGGVVSDFTYNDIALNVEVATYHEDNSEEKFVSETVDHGQIEMQRQPLLVGGLEKSDTESLSDADESNELRKIVGDNENDNVKKELVNRTVLDSDDFEVDVVGDDNVAGNEHHVQEKHSVKSNTSKIKSTAKHRGIKRKLVTKEKVKVIKPKSRKNDSLNSDRPLIVGGLPPAIMPADAPEVPNPYQYDPKASVTALGHRQLRAAYRVTRDLQMAQAPPPTQKFRLHPIRRSTSVTETPVISPASDSAVSSSASASALTDKVGKVADASSSPAALATVTNNASDSSIDDKSTGHRNNEEKDVKRSSSTFSSLISRDQRTRHSLRISREKKTVDHPKAPATVEFEYKSPLAHTYVHLASPSSSSSIKTIVGHVKKIHEDVDARKKSSEHQNLKDGHKRFERIRPQRFSPSRRLSSEEIWDRKYGRGNDSFRFGRNNDGIMFPRRYRRISHEDRHSKYREFGRYDEPYRDYNFGRNEPGRIFEKKSHQESRLDDCRSTERTDVWRKLANFDPTVPPPVLPKKQFKDGAGGPSDMNLPKGNVITATPCCSVQKKVSCSESWRKLAPNPPPPPPPPPPDTKETKNVFCKTADDDKSLNEKTESPRLANVNTAQNGRKDSDEPSVEACVPSTSEQSSLISDVQKVGSGNQPVDEMPDSYRPTPICNLPPRPDSVLGIPPIVFEQDHTVTGILKRSCIARNSANITNHISPKLEEPLREETTRLISGYGGTNVVNLEAGKNDLDTSVVEEKNKSLATGDLKKEPLDYVSTANELARLTSEITEEPLHSKSEPRLKKSEFSTILSDPRRAKNVSAQEESFDNHTFHQSGSATKVGKDEEQSVGNLFEDLSSLIAEYDEIDK